MIKINQLYSKRRVKSYHNQNEDMLIKYLFIILLVKNDNQEQSAYLSLTYNYKNRSSKSMLGVDKKEYKANKINLLSSLNSYTNLKNSKQNSINKTFQKGCRPRPLNKTTYKQFLTDSNRGSLSTYSEQFSVINNSDLLDFTFSNDQSYLRKKNRGFSDQSPYSVILFSILFNHIYLQEQRNDLSQVIIFSSRLVRNIHLAFNSLEEEINKRKKVIGVCCTDFFEMLSNKTKSSQAVNKYEQLRRFFSRFPPQTIQYVFNQTEKKMKKRRKYLPSCQRQQENQIEYEKQKRLYSIIKKINSFSCITGIRTRIFSGQQKYKIGLKTSMITLQIRQNVQSKMYSLKAVSCYEQKQ